MTGMIKLPGHDLSLLYNSMRRGKKKKIKPSLLLLGEKKKKTFPCTLKTAPLLRKKFEIHSLLWTIKELATKRPFKKELIIVSEKKMITCPNVA